MSAPSSLRQAESATWLEDAPLEGKRLLILFPHLTTPGGAMTYALRLAGILAGRGAVVGILTLRADHARFACPPGAEVITLHGPLTSSLGYWAFLPFWQARINESIDRWRPDLLVPQVFPANWWGWLYKARRPKTKLLWVCHEPSAFIHSMAWIRALRPWWKCMLARTLRPLLCAIDISLARLSDGIVANSRFTASELLRVYGREADAVAYPGIDLAEYAGDTLPKGREVITVARLTRFKRIDFLLEVFAGLLKAYPDLVYNVVGTGEDEEFLRSHAQKLGVGGSVLFHGSVDDGTLAALYRRSSLFLHGSIEEPFGMAPMEAVAWGTPVVAHNSGGPREFVTDNCGRLVDSLEVADWTSQITSYLASLWAAETSADQVRASAEGFDWSLSLLPAVERIAKLCEGARDATS